MTFRWDRMRKGFQIYGEMRKFFPIYEEAVSHIWLCIRSLTISLFMRTILFSFLSMYSDYSGMEGLPGSLPPTVLISNSFVLLKYTTTTSFRSSCCTFIGPGIGMRYRGTSAVFRWNFLYQSGETAGAEEGGGKVISWWVLIISWWRFNRYMGFKETVAWDGLFVHSTRSIERWFRIWNFFGLGSKNRRDTLSFMLIGVSPDTFIL